MGWQENRIKNRTRLFIRWDTYEDHQASPTVGRLFQYGANGDLDPGSRHSEDFGNVMEDLEIINTGESDLLVSTSAVRLRLDDEYVRLPSRASLNWREAAELAIYVESGATNPAWSLVTDLQPRANALETPTGVSLGGGHPGSDPELSTRFRSNPGVTKERAILVPWDLVVTDIRVYCRDVPTTAGTYTLTVTGIDPITDEVHPLLSGAFDLTSLVADTPTSLTLNTDTRRLNLREEDYVTCTVASDNDDLANGSFLLLIGATKREPYE